MCVVAVVRCVWCCVVFVCVVSGGFFLFVSFWCVSVCRLFRDILIVYEHVLVPHAFTENQLHRLYVYQIFSVFVFGTGLFLIHQTGEKTST